MNRTEQDLDAYIAIACAIAVEEAKAMPTTPELRWRAHDIVEGARDRIAHVRRAERARRPSNIVSGAIRDVIRTMNGAQVLARLAELRGLYPTMQFAHRDFEHLSDDDLRSALEDVESLIERGL